MASTVDILNFLIILFVSLIFVLAGDSTKGQSNKDGLSDRAGVWFGPRLGKRSLQLNNDDRSESFRRLFEAADTLKYYYDQLPYELQVDDPQPKAAKKVIFTPKLGRALSDYQEKKTFANVDFTPRLGRRKLQENFAAPVDEIMEPVQRESSEHFFSPRLGRNYYAFSPRLGRDISDYVYAEPEIRVARSANTTK